MKIRACSESDIPLLEQLLQANGLPFKDINEHLATFYIGEDSDGCAIGCVGFECYGPIGLLRSLCVDKDNRGRAKGLLLLSYVEEKARLMGVIDFYLLTTDASEYFSKHGFSVVARSDVPEEIKATQQFSNLCPASALVMMKSL